MGTFRFLVALFILPVLFLTSLHSTAQPPPLLNYQGRVTVDGTNFHGTGQFMFALVDAGGIITYWSNDGNVTPTTAVPLNVDKGLYSVLLGDTSLTGMNVPLNPSVFSFSEIYLRVWFNDGVSGFTQLTPDQRLVPVGSAFVAMTVPDGAIQNAQLADEAVTGSKIAPAAITTTLIADSAVQANNIRSGSVSTDKLMNNAVTTIKIADNAVTTAKMLDGVVTADKIADLSVTTAKIDDFAVTAAKLANDAVTTAKLDDHAVTAAKVDAPSFAQTFWLIGGNEDTTAGTHYIGTNDEEPLELRVNGQRALRIEPHTSSPTLVAGSPVNWADGVGIVIAGGGVSSGANIAEANYATISGGWIQRIEAGAQWATIGGGIDQQIQSNAVGAVISGGEQGLIGANARYSAIGGGHINRIQEEARYATIAGGRLNRIERDAWHAVIAGGWQNWIGTNSTSSAIGGGQSIAIYRDSEAAHIGGGQANQIHNDSPRSHIGGGSFNVVERDAPNSTIAGGALNRIELITENATIGGGSGNVVERFAHRATIGGGQANRVKQHASHSFIGGGYANQIQKSYSAIAGGENNEIAAGFGVASHVFIGGGENNRAWSNASHAVIGGGINNRILPNARWSTIPGGADNQVWADYGFAAGRNARVNHEGSFVWADSGSDEFASTAADQAAFRVSGGVRFTSGSLSFSHNMTWTPGDSSGWSITSDVNAKDQFESVDQQQVLLRLVSLPIQEWSFKGYTQRHVGPTAQDFHAAFNDWSNSDTTIDTGHLHGVALISIQALHERNEQLAEENQQLRAELDAIREHLGM